MVVEPRKKEGDSPKPSRKPLLISVVAHLLVFVLIIFGLPHFQSDPILSEPVPIELVNNIGELTTTNRKPVESPKPKDPIPKPPQKKEEPQKKPESHKSTPEPTPSPPVEETLKDPPKEEKPVEKDIQKPPQKIEKKPDPKPSKKPDKPNKKTEENDFDSLLKDLAPAEKEQPDTDEVSDQTSETDPAPNVSRFSDILSMSEIDALRQQLSQCWSVMAGAANPQDQVVELSVTVNQDRTVANAKVVDQGKYNSNPFFRAAADSAMRALRNPNCTPLRVPPDKYNQWHQMRIVFDPKEMF